MISIKTNVFTKFYDDWAKNVTSRVSHVPRRIKTILQLNGRIQETHNLTKCHEDWAKNVSSRLFTCFHNIHIEKTAPTLMAMFFPLIRTIFELVRDINKIDVLTKFHDDWAKM
ncbi:hypothetical protein DPMN_008356 [Dreissena polymorpha]|uniref:Uncharacterized protein n=1 Tax=Dreissena polymorpha TaxID=45954 RepID=A0A9D4MXX8_DREPO|nr:hypothetical protein DPMN_008356 [Dreissena polymorpha]